MKDNQNNNVKQTQENTSVSSTEAIVRRDPPFSPVVVCSTEQIEEFRNDTNFRELPKGSAVFPIFQPNKTQLMKIKKLLEGADRYILTSEGFVKVN